MWTRTRFAWITALIALSIPTQFASAHEGLPPAPHDFWRAWNWEPTILLGLALTAWIYVRGVTITSARLWPPALTWRMMSFAAGLAALFLALISPLDALGLSLFSAHMAQHSALILAAAPLLVLSLPIGALLLGLPRAMRHGFANWWKQAHFLRIGWHALSQPPVVWSLHALALWVWHAPVLYQLALRNEQVHRLEHISFFGTSLLFWWMILSPPGGNSQNNRGLNQGLAVLYLFTLALQSGLLGALMTFAPEPWYAAYRTTTAAWSLTPLEDQHLAGALMWIPSGAIYLLAALSLFVSLLTALERRQ